MKHFEAFTGRVGKINELKKIGENNAVVNFTVAESIRKKNQAGQYEDVATLWTNVTLFGPEAHNFVRSAKPGVFVTVVGYREARTYTPNDSNEVRTVQNVIAEQVSIAITRWNYIEGIGSTNSGNKPAGQTQSQSQVNTGNSFAQVDSDPFATTNSNASVDPFASSSSFDDDPFAL